MALIWRRAVLLLALLAVSFAASTCHAEQDSREAHIQLQSAAKVSLDLSYPFWILACVPQNRQVRATAT